VYFRHGHQTASADEQVCPSSPAASAGEADDEAGRFGPGHSSKESIADFALHVRGQSVPGRGG
jgi:hypothetical protein